MTRPGSHKMGRQNDWMGNFVVFLYWFKCRSDGNILFDGNNLKGDFFFVGTDRTLTLTLNSSRGRGIFFPS